MVVLMAAITLLLSSCVGKVPSEFVGKWEGEAGPYQRVVVKIEKDGHYNITIFQSRERYDAINRGDVVMVNDNIIKLPSDYYDRASNANSYESDPCHALVSVYSSFFLRSDGAFSKSEAELNSPYCYLRKVSK